MESNLTFSFSNRNLFHESNVKWNLIYNRDYSLNTLQEIGLCFIT